MNIDAAVLSSTLSSSQKVSQYEVTVAKSANDQYKNVAGKLIESIDDGPRPSAQPTGHRLNVVA